MPQIIMCPTPFDTQEHTAPDDNIRPCVIKVLYNMGGGYVSGPWTFLVYNIDDVHCSGGKKNKLILVYVQ